MEAEKMEMFLKRKRVVLSMKNKADIIQRLDNGESSTALANEYGIGASTICDIRKKRDSILAFARENGSNLRKTMKKGDNAALEEALFSWFKKEKAEGGAVCNFTLSKMALQMNADMSGDPEFKASAGWLKRFKARFGIKALEKRSENLSIGELTAKEIKEKFTNMLAEENFAIDDVYFAVCATLDLTSLPASGNTGNRCHILFCSNANGSHKLPLLFFSKDREPPSVQGKVALPFSYRQYNPQFENISSIFSWWYDYNFVLTVKKKNRSTDKKSKVLLVVPDNFVDDDVENFSRDDGSFRLFIMSTDVPQSFQLLNRNFVESFTAQYRKILLQNTLLSDHRVGSIFDLQDVLNRMPFRECGYHAADAWDSLDPSVIMKTWCKVFPHAKSILKIAPISYLSELLQTVRAFPSVLCFDEESVRQWCRVEDDDIIMEEEQHSSPINVREREEVIIPDDVDSVFKSSNKRCRIDDIGSNLLKSKREAMNRDTPEDSVCPSVGEACEAFATVLKWMETKEDCTTQQLLMVKRLQMFAQTEKLHEERRSLCD